MKSLIQFMDKYDDVGRALIDCIEFVVILVGIIGLAPALMWLSSYGQIQGQTKSCGGGKLPPTFLKKTVYFCCEV